MAKVYGQVLGGEIVELEADTVLEVKEELGVEGHTASVNGEPAGDEDLLGDYNMVTLASPVKGGIS